MAAALVTCAPAVVRAQNADGSNATQTISDKLPRPGYEPRNLQIGAATLASEIGVEARYDSNVFAVSTKPISDFIFIITPHLRLEGVGDRLKYQSDIYADIREYADNNSESHTTFGFAGSGSYSINDKNRFAAGAHFDRLAETRNDPEANTNRDMPPRLLDSIGGNFEYGYQTGRIGLELRTAAGHLGYRSPEDAERSLATYYLAVRATVIATPMLALFVQPYVNRRDFDQAFDSGGVDRDMTTTGIIGGARLTTTDHWSGEIGIGAFNANPDDASLRSFSGFAASANVSWSPTRRTTVTLKGASGDSATVRAGAIGRDDSSINLRIDQEVRHNLRFTATIGHQKTHYTGLPNVLRTTFGSAQIEYLMNRTVSLFVTASYAERRATPVTDGFDRGYVGIGIRLRH
nr:outer membrane beta-barrel protein [Polymorphobacter sp.]